MQVLKSTQDCSFTKSGRHYQATLVKIHCRCYYAQSIFIEGYDHDALPAWEEWARLAVQLACYRWCVLNWTALILKYYDIREWWPPQDKLDLGVSWDGSSFSLRMWSHERSQILDIAFHENVTHIRSHPSDRPR